MTADCLGALACVHPDVILPKLVELQQKHSHDIVFANGVIPSEDAASRANANVCVSVATAVKVAVYGKVDENKLAVHMESLVSLLQQEVGVRDAALLMIYSAVHHMPQTVATVLKSVIMPQLYVIAGVKLERKVDLGAFAHTVDDRPKSQEQSGSRGCR